jgi:hypothetical protein
MGNRNTAMAPWVHATSRVGSSYSAGPAVGLEGGDKPLAIEACRNLRVERDRYPPFVDRLFVFRLGHDDSELFELRQNRRRRRRGGSQHQRIRRRRTLSSLSSNRRKTVRAANPTAVTTTLSAYIAAPEHRPMAATSHRPAAVVSPCTEIPVRKIAPAPRSRCQRRQRRRCGTDRRPPDHLSRRFGSGRTVSISP